MIDLLALGIAAAVGVPGGILLDNELRKLKADLKEKQELEKQKQELKDYLTEHFENKVKFTEVHICAWGYWAEARTDLGKFELQRKAKAIECKFSESEFHGLIIEYRKPIEYMKYQYIELPPTSLLLGYSEDDYIIVDMLKTPHAGVVGLSTSGKSKCVEVALKNLRGADITLLNCMQKDFRGIQANRINGNKEILSYLQRVSENKQRRERPHYIVIDEYNVLSNTKGIDKAIQDLLSQARHYNVFLIVLMQLGNKEDCKFKNLFNCRLVFRTIEDSTVKAFLGATPQDGALMPREFYLLHTELVKGTTLTL